jgi:hypothetical protein
LQAEDYVDFADERDPLGIPNCLNLLSNLPFTFVGGVAFARVWPDVRAARSARAFLDVLPAFAFALGVSLTAVGSSLFHLDPGNPAGLVLDRIPMTFAFMGVSALAIDRYFAPETRHLLVLPLLVIGVGSVLFWHPFGHGLAPYILVQCLPVLVVAVVLLLVWPKDPEQKALGVALLLYGFAKLLEEHDDWFYEAFREIVSGHTLKHLAAAAASYAVIPLLTAPLPDPSRPEPPSDPEAAPLPPP